MLRLPSAPASAGIRRRRLAAAWRIHRRSGLLLGLRIEAGGRALWRNLLRELLALGRLRNLGGNLLRNSLRGLLDLWWLVSGFRGFANRLGLRLLDLGSIWMRLVGGWNIGASSIRGGPGSNRRHGRIRGTNACGSAGAGRVLPGITGVTRRV